MGERIEGRVGVSQPAEEGGTLSSIERVGWAILAVTGLFGLLFLSPRATGGLLLGGVLGLLNLRVLGRTLGMLVTRKPGRAKLRAQLLAPLRYLALAVALYGGLVLGGVSPVALLAGLSIVVVAVLASGLSPTRRRA